MVTQHIEIKHRWWPWEIKHRWWPWSRKPALVQLFCFSQAAPLCTLCKRKSVPHVETSILCRQKVPFPIPFVVFCIAANIYIFGSLQTLLKSQALVCYYIYQGTGANHGFLTKYTCITWDFASPCFSPSDFQFLVILKMWIPENIVWERTHWFCDYYSRNKKRTRSWMVSISPHCILLIGKAEHVMCTSGKGVNMSLKSPM